MNKKILFVTGTRADFGKLKPLIRAVKQTPGFEYRIFATGMHMLAKYGNTVAEIQHSDFENIFMYINQIEGESMEVVLANTILGLTRYLNEHPVDLIVIHGDRIEALAGATTGALRNTLVAHVEGGEVSGTIDDLIRHATTKLSHIHFVASAVAARRLEQLGEHDQSIFHIGSPDVDTMLSDTLPTIEEVRGRYDIHFRNYAICMLHPVTTEVEHQYQHARILTDVIATSDRNYIIVYPNNDLGTNHISDAYNEVLSGRKNVLFYPSLRFEYFLTLLKHSDFIIGNSSAGIHEAPVYGVPTINIGTRQDNRLQYESILNVPFDRDKIKGAIQEALAVGRYTPCEHYGDGKSTEKFLAALQSERIWRISKQKKFRDISFPIAQ